MKIKETIYLDALVIGSGCAGFNAADWLYDLGVKKIALATEGINMGTSRNTGSDKQTYYKLSLCSDEADSVADMAKSLFEGGGVNGDTAYIEAANSARCFIKLANAGVRFPTNEYGEFAGYMTDHDSHKRATSAGPLTSKLMTEALENSVKSKGIKIYDKTTIFKLVVKENHICGALGICQGELVAFSCHNIIMATGGPSYLYETSVYPASQTGMSGLAIEAGAETANLCEWQYGLASVDFRWNVSGTYQQVIPKYISVDENGNEREFLNDYMDPKKAANLVFMKGYQWPFDSAKIKGSSLIDMIVYNETVKKGNKVYMDFRSEPSALRDGFDALSEESHSYLEKSGALIKTPVERLAHMNKGAIALYLSHGIDLYKEPLRIAVCAQHNNGGIGVDSNWETDIKGLYVAGEAAGTFGAIRPGGSALNSTQVGSLRAAEHIRYKKERYEKFSDFQKEADCILSKISFCPEFNDQIEIIRRNICRKMSECAAFVRNPIKIQHLILEIDNTDIFAYEISRPQLEKFLKLRDMLITAKAVLSAMLLSCEAVGSHGGALVIGKGTGECEKIVATKNNETYLKDVRPLPKPENWFENVWNDYLRRTEDV